MRWLFFLMLLIPAAFAAQIEGTLYLQDLSLAKGAIVSIDTTPVQTVVAADGTYTLTVPQGAYTLKATYERGFSALAATHGVEVVDEGIFTADLVLSLDVSEEESIFNEELDEPETIDEEVFPWIILIAGIIILAILSYVAFKRKRKPKIDDGPKKKVLKWLQDQGGRASQRDLRKAMPWSEAKVSLILTELEHEEKIMKIKKGKGNVVVLR